MDKSFIKRFQSILSIISFITEKEGEVEAIERKKMIASYQDAVIEFGNDLESTIDSDIKNQVLPDMVHGSERYFNELADSKERIIRCIEEYCELIYRYAACYDATQRSEIDTLMKEKEGQISLLIRFGFLYSMNQIHREDREATFKKAVDRLQTLGEYNGDFFPVHLLWQYSARKYLPRFDINDTAIVIQGPVLYERDFTLETLYRYRYIYPQIDIILSTWKNEIKPEFRRNASSIGIIIVESDKPSDVGPYNLNLQLTNTRAGIDKAMNNNGIRYIMKTRTDQRFFMPDFVIYMKNMLEQYKPGGDDLFSRIAFLGGKTTLWSFPFRIADFYAFGDARDIKKLYSVSAFGSRIKDTFDNHQAEQSQLVLEKGRHENASELYDLKPADRIRLSKEFKTRDPESYLIQTFYEESILGRELTENDDLLMNYWEFLRNYTVIIDPDMLIFYWYKYSHSYAWFDTCETDGGLTQSLWLDLYLHGDVKIPHQEMD